MDKIITIEYIRDKYGSKAIDYALNLMDKDKKQHLTMCNIEQLAKEYKQLKDDLSY